MRISGAEVVVRALKEGDVRYLFGIPGTHNIELYDRLAEDTELKAFLITDEQSAAFLADGVARASGKVAAANLVPGAGLTHALSGITECFLDQIPLLVLLCGIRKDTGKAFQLHEIDQAAMVRPVSKRVFQPQTHSELYTCLLSACSLAKQAPCGPVVVEVPANLYFVPGDVADDIFHPRPEVSPPVFDSGQLPAIAEILNSSHSILLYLGLGALESREYLVRFADDLDAIVFTTISGKGVFPEAHPRWGWSTIGRAAPPEIWKIASSCDCMLAIGCRFGEVGTGSYGFEPPEKVIHVDVDAGVFHKNVRASATCVADARTFVRELMESGLLERREINGNRMLKLTQAHREVRRQQQAGIGSRVHPHWLLETIQRVCGSETIFVADSGNGTFLAMEHLRLSYPRSFLAPVDYSCMGYSVPAAIGAKIGAPDRPVVALVGDGAFLMTGMELLTAATYGIGIMAFVLRDGELSQIAQFQKASMNRETNTELAPFDARQIAAALGVETLAMERNEDIDSVVENAYEITKMGKPVLIDVAIDYSAPTFFSKGVVVTNFLRFSWRDRIRVLARLLKRKITD